MYSVIMNVSAVVIRLLNQNQIRITNSFVSIGKVGVLQQVS